MLHAVIFDFDGIIVNTEPVHYWAYQEIFVPLGLGFSWEEYVSRYIGFDDREIFKRVFSANDHELENEVLEQLMSRKTTAFRRLAGSGIKPHPGVVELIRALSGYLPLALCSGAVRSEIAPILEHLDLSILKHFLQWMPGPGKFSRDWPWGSLSDACHCMGCRL
jgi:beta-phosphoglucomutase